MVLSRFHPVFHVLLWLQAALAYVEPPTNVTLDCHNLQNILKWSYGQLSPGLRFKIIIRKYNGDPIEHWVNSSDREADLSFLSNPDNEYLIEMKAVIDAGESEFAPPDGIEFSYFKDSLVQKKCFVDLPPVNISAQADAIVRFRFPHPWKFYKVRLPVSQNPKRRNKKSQASQIGKPLPGFTYSAVVNNQAPHQFTCEEEECEETLPVNATHNKHCLTITGEMNKMTVKTTQSYCALSFREPPKPNNLLYIIVGSLLAVSSAVALIFVMVYRKKTKPSMQTQPSSLIFNQSLQKTGGVNKDYITEVEVTSPTPLLDTETDDFISPVSPSFNDDLRIRIKGIREHEGELLEEEQPNNEGTEYMRGSGIEDDEPHNSSDAPSDYERRETLVCVDLGLDEPAKGYRG